jgi:hypothetical protein
VSHALRDPGVTARDFEGSFDAAAVLWRVPRAQRSIFGQKLDDAGRRAHDSAPLVRVKALAGKRLVPVAFDEELAAVRATRDDEHVDRIDDEALRTRRQLEHMNGSGGGPGVGQKENGLTIR